MNSVGFSIYQFNHHKSSKNYKGKKYMKQKKLLTKPKSALKDRLGWFREARFGMFMHWGLYSVPAGEWEGKSAGEWMQMSNNISADTYESLALQFNPVKFDANKWVSVIREAGMKYLVFTAKHHDGFCLFKSKKTDYNIVDATPFGRDPVKALTDACRKQGIVPCLYYSVKDWHHPEYPIEMTWRTKEHPLGFKGHSKPEADYLKYLDFMQAQLRELLTNYGQIGIIWFDWGVMPPLSSYQKKSDEIKKMIRSLQPSCLINDRFGGIKGDYGTPEQRIPGQVQSRIFESCITLNNSWNYNKKDHQWKDAATVVHSLVDIVQKGGNYLLNVGPTPTGIIPKEAIKILKQVGKWLQVNGESVYGAGTSTFHTKFLGDIGAVTEKQGLCYLHIFKWPADRKLFWYDVGKNQFVKAYFLADKKRTPLKVDVNPQSLILHLPLSAPDSLDSVIVLQLKGAKRWLSK